MGDVVSVATTSPDHVAEVAAGRTIASGVASKYWLALVADPPGSVRSLWLQVSGSWHRLDNPTPAIEQSVQHAFANAATFEVAVWYDGQIVTGLVVRTK